MPRSHKIRRRLTKDQVCTIPNALSLLRLLLIPVFLYLYRVKAAYVPALGVVALSALTDALDGAIARRFHMVSDLGKFLDPLADKLTQCAMLLCLIQRYRQACFLLGLFVIKELAMLGFALLTLQRTDRVHSARWYGKVNTALLESSAAALLFLPTLPGRAVTALSLLCAASLLLTLLLYAAFFSRMLRVQPL
ncbi:MAG: CDP-alcohol phosphatidyltransferase family protein [Oscillospiraceae bacterium]